MLWLRELSSQLSHRINKMRRFSAKENNLFENQIRIERKQISREHNNTMIDHEVQPIFVLMYPTIQWQQ